MSVIKWNNPNDPNPDDPTDYPIGTINWTESHGPAKDAFEIMMGSVSNKYGLVGALISKFYNTFSNGALCPDYGLWGGKNWAGGERLAESESEKIGWEKDPCYNNSIRQIATNPNLYPESCISLVDALFGRVFSTRPN